MATRYSKQRNGVYEHYDSLEEYNRAQAIDLGWKFGLAGLLVGGVLAYLAIQKLGFDHHLPKLARMAIISVTSGLVGFVGARFAVVISTFIAIIIFFLFVLGALSIIVPWVWHNI